MYNKLLNSLNQAPDFSLQTIVEKIRQSRFDTELLSHMDSVEDYQTFFDECLAISQNQATVRTISVVLIFNKLNQLPSQRTSRYL